MKKIEEIEKLIIVVDMINGFVKVGNMSDKYIEHTIPDQIKLLTEFKENNEGIAIVKDTHKKDCAEFKKFPEHCIEGTYESELIDELKEFEKDALVYPKNSTSTMHAPGFVNDLEKMVKLKEVVIIGCCTDICVLNAAIPLQTYLDQHDRDVKIKVYKNCVETCDAPNHNRDEYNEMAFKVMAQAGIEII